jgi:hypothetical protein
LDEFDVAGASGYFSIADHLGVSVKGRVDCRLEEFRGCAQDTSEKDGGIFDEI